jgi:hypothetical protein
LSLQASNVFPPQLSNSPTFSKQNDDLNYSTSKEVELEEKVKMLENKLKICENKNQQLQGQVNYLGEFIIKQTAGSSSYFTNQSYDSSTNNIPVANLSLESGPSTSQSFPGASGNPETQFDVLRNPIPIPSSGRPAPRGVKRLSSNTASSRGHVSIDSHFFVAGSTTNNPVGNAGSEEFFIQDDEEPSNKRSKAG